MNPCPNLTEPCRVDGCRANSYRVNDCQVYYEPDRALSGSVIFGRGFINPTTIYPTAFYPTAICPTGFGRVQTWVRTWLFARQLFTRQLFARHHLPDREKNQPDFWKYHLPMGAKNRLLTWVDGFQVNSCRIDEPMSEPKSEPDLILSGI